MMKTIDLQYPRCPIRNVIARVNDKWSLLIVCSLHANGKMRYKDLRRDIPDISQKMLSSTLKKLEADHLILREAYAEIPPRVEYSLTAIGDSLIPVVEKMINWAQEHFEEVTK